MESKLVLIITGVSLFICLMVQMCNGAMIDVEFQTHESSYTVMTDTASIVGQNWWSRKCIGTENIYYFYVKSVKSYNNTVIIDIMDGNSVSTLTIRVLKRQIRTLVTFLNLSINKCVYMSF